MSSSLANGSSSDIKPPIKLLLLPDVTIFTCPLLSINQLRANVNDSVVRLSATSRLNTLIIEQTKVTPLPFI